MGNSYGAAQFPSLFDKCVLHWTGTDETINGFPIIPSGVTVTPAGTWSNPLDLGNNKSVKKFDNSTNFISLSDNDAWTILGADFTICFWVRFWGDEANDTIFSQITGPDGSSWGIRMLHYGAYIKNITLVSDGANCYYHYDSMSCDFDTWYHIVVERSGTSCLMYVDAVSVTPTVGTAFGSITNLAGTLEIGRVNTATPHYHAGYLKDLLVYKGRALTVPEIKLVMARTHPITGTGMIAGPYDYYKVIS
ncbi:MAG: LamG-like jellyroll fold domain-containing protein [Dehalococcoidales bacterium]|jgi:hypothetical protein